MRCIGVFPLQLAAAGWWTTLARERDPISRGTVSETSCAAWRLRAIYQKHAPQCQVSHRSAFPWLVDLKEVRKVDQVLANGYHLYPGGKAFSTSWLLWIVLQARCFVGTLSNAFDTEFCLEALEIALTGGEATDVPLRSGVSVPPPVTSWPRLKDRGDQASGWSGSRTLVTGQHPGGETYGGQSNMEEVVPARAYSDGGSLKSACPDFLWRRTLPCKTP